MCTTTPTEAVIGSGVFVPADSDAALPPTSAPSWAARPATENPFIGVAVRASDGRVLTAAYEPDELVLRLHVRTGATAAEVRFPAPDFTVDEDVEAAFRASARAWTDPAPGPAPGTTHAVLAIRRDHPTPEAFPFRNADLRVRWLEFLAYADGSDSDSGLLSYAEWLDAEVDVILNTMKDIAKEDGLEGVMRLHNHLQAIRAEIRFLTERAAAQGDRS